MALCSDPPAAAHFSPQHCALAVGDSALHWPLNVSLDAKANPSEIQLVERYTLPKYGLVSPTFSLPGTTV